MDSVEKALWFIEGHFGGDVSLDDIARAGGVSRFQMSRAVATGQSAMRYLRSRRLSEAARTLAVGAPDILSVALNAGYASHEAFTRAFRDHFGMTPEAVRAQRDVQNLTLVEAIKMRDTLIDDLEPPSIENGKPLLIAGLGGAYSHAGSKDIPALWQRLQPHLGNVPGQVRVRGVTFGVCYNMDDAGHFDYLAGVEVSDFSELPAEFSRLRIPAQRYAKFTHRGHVTMMRSVSMTIWTRWLPESGYEAVDAPFLEYYGEEFDGRTGMGGFQIWIPIKG
jgi:AraC family transcriptional regulator